jgi:hypothetical protein
MGVENMQKRIIINTGRERRKSKIIATVLALNIIVLSTCGILPTPETVVVYVTATPVSVKKTPVPTLPTPTTPPTALPTDTPLPTNTPRPTPTHLPQPEIWSISLEEAYKLFYALGYSAEMYPSEGYPAGTDSWAVHFYDPSSYYESDYWYWYGNSVYAWADTTTDPVFQISITKNYLDFPVSGIDERADKFFRRILGDLGYGPSTIEEIMGLMTNKLADAREDVGKILCYGRLETGGYVSVWLEQSDYGYYWYSIDIRTTPICESNDSSTDL